VIGAKLKEQNRGRTLRRRGGKEVSKRVKGIRRRKYQGNDYSEGKGF